MLKFTVVPFPRVNAIVVPGPAGPAGVDGKSAYTLAVESGFVGTLSQWLASLEGADGPAGANGAAGIQGPQGLQGPQGVQGPAGTVAPIAANTVLGNNTAGTAAPIALTPAQARTLLDVPANSVLTSYAKLFTNTTNGTNRFDVNDDVYASFMFSSQSNSDTFPLLTMLANAEEGFSLSQGSSLFSLSQSQIVFGNSIGHSFGVNATGYTMGNVPAFRTLLGLGTGDSPTFAGVTATGNINAGASSGVWGGSLRAGGTASNVANLYIFAQSNGVMQLYDSSISSFNRIALGGTTASFPSIKRNATAINFRLADDSADCAITASTITASGNVNIGTNRLTAGQVFLQGRGIMDMYAGPSGEIGICVNGYLNGTDCSFGGRSFVFYNPSVNNSIWSMVIGDAAGAIALRNGTNAQRLNIYGTYANSGADHRRFYISSTTAGAFTIGVEGAGTGATGNTLDIGNELYKRTATVGNMATGHSILRWQTTYSSNTTANIDSLGGLLHAGNLAIPNAGTVPRTAIRLGNGGTRFCIYAQDYGFPTEIEANGKLLAPSFAFRNTLDTANADIACGAITASGTVSVGTFTVATLPSASANSGRFAQVTDASVTANGSPVAGGGANRAAVFSNGTTWDVVVA